MKIQETFLNKTEGYRFGESDVYDAGIEDVGKLFIYLQREYGRCVNSVYIDGPDGQPKKVGWVFEKRCKYDDCNKWYVREVWVTLLDTFEPQPAKVEYHELS